MPIRLGGRARLYMGSFHTQLGWEDRKQGTQEIINARCSESKPTLVPCSLSSQISVLPLLTSAVCQQPCEEEVRFNITSPLKESYEVGIVKPIFCTRNLKFRGILESHKGHTASNEPDLGFEHRSPHLQSPWPSFLVR